MDIDFNFQGAPIFDVWISRDDNETCSRKAWQAKMFFNFEMWKKKEHGLLSVKDR